MTKSTFSTLTLLSTIALLTSVKSHAMAEYTWDNTAGFQPIDNCSVIGADSIPFKISGPAQKLSSNGGKSLTLAQQTLIKVTSDSAASKGLSNIIVVSSSSSSSAVAERDAQGSVRTEGLQDLGDTVLALGSGTPVKEIADLKIKTAESFLQASIKDNQYQILNCVIHSQPRQFILFDVFSADSSLPVARLGISTDDTKILRSARAMTPEDAEKSIAKLQASSASRSQTPQGGEISAARPATASPLKLSSKPETARVEPSFFESAMTNLSTTLKQSGEAAKAAATAATQVPSKIASQLAAAPKALLDQMPSVPVIQGSLDYVVCSTQATVQVKDTDLRKDLFKANKLEKVIPVQSFGTDRQMFEGQSYQKVQFTNRNSEIGWIPSNLVVAEASCFNIDEATDASRRAAANSVGSGSLASDQFPMIHRPVKSYKIAPLRFRSMRGGGRLHAACDLYRPNGENVVAIGDGVVVRGKYYFYQGVFAIEVRHNGGFIARYGEVLGRSAPGVGASARVKGGQTVGYVGTVNSGCCSPMMHFELYRGTASGPLTVRHGGFERRSDLMDPTNYLSAWEKKKFGASY